MIGILFEFGSEIVEVRILDDIVLFRTSQFGTFGTIDNLKLDKKGVIREFPDLKDNEEWQKIARERFKEKMKKYKSEMDRADYIMEDLKKFGYKPMYMQRQGFRVQKLK